VGSTLQFLDLKFISLAEASKVGFSFLAISQTLNNLGVKHGFVDGTGTEGPKNHRLDGLGTPSIEFGEVTETGPTTVYTLLSDETFRGIFFGAFSALEFDFAELQVNARSGGVRVPFEVPFDALPSVIVTPVFTGDPCETTDVFQCVVETITTEYCFVKCVCSRLDLAGTSLTLHPVSFNIVAVGPSTLPQAEE